ncbi:Uncharacterised protein [Mycobacterium tuberculosis]|nr:Uncharacterised protein [Mycobacterium tuberculosis]
MRFASRPRNNASSQSSALRKAAVWAMAPRWLGPWLTSSGMRRMSPTASGPAIASAAFTPHRFHALVADVRAKASSAPGTLRYGVNRAPGSTRGP